MPIKKSKSSTKTKSQKSKPASSKSWPAGGPLPPYGVAIRDAIARGDTREMRRVSTSASKYLKDVQAALAAMDKAIKDLEG